MPKKTDLIQQYRAKDNKKELGHAAEEFVYMVHQFKLRTNLPMDLAPMALKLKPISWGDNGIGMHQDASEFLGILFEVLHENEGESGVIKKHFLTKCNMIFKCLSCQAENLKPEERVSYIPLTFNKVSSIIFQFK